MIFLGFDSFLGGLNCLTPKILQLRFKWMIDVIKKYWKVDVSGLKFKQLILTFLISVLLPAFLMSFVGSLNHLNALLEGESVDRKSVV